MLRSITTSSFLFLSTLSGDKFNGTCRLINSPPLMLLLLPLFSCKSFALQLSAQLINLMFSFTVAVFNFSPLQLPSLPNAIFSLPLTLPLLLLLPGLLVLLPPTLQPLIPPFNRSADVLLGDTSFITTPIATDATAPVVRGDELLFIDRWSLSSVVKPSFKANIAVWVTVVSFNDSIDLKGLLLLVVLSAVSRDLVARYIVHKQSNNNAHKGRIKNRV